MKCEACGKEGIVTSGTGTLMECALCGVLWGRCNGAWVEVPASCTCDDMGESPCPEHGYGQLECECGVRFRAPIVVKSFMALKCPACGQCFAGYEENCANGCWYKISEQEYRDGHVIRDHK
jgi:hypothetical protein